MGRATFWGCWGCRAAQSRPEPPGACWGGAPWEGAGVELGRCLRRGGRPYCRAREREEGDHADHHEAHARSARLGEGWGEGAGEGWGEGEGWPTSVQPVAAVRASLEIRVRVKVRVRVRARVRVRV